MKQKSVTSLHSWSWKRFDDKASSVPLTLRNIKSREWRWSAALQLQLKRHLLQPLEFFLLSLALQQAALFNSLAVVVLLAELPRRLKYLHLKRQLGIHQPQLRVLREVKWVKTVATLETTPTRCFRRTPFSSGFCLYLYSLRDTLFIQSERSSNTSVNLRGLLSWQQRVVLWQSASQLLNNTEHFYKSNSPLSDDRSHLG